MNCELCGIGFRQNDLVVPVGAYDSFPDSVGYVFHTSMIVTKDKGIHVACLREVVESLRQVGEAVLTLRALPHRVYVEGSMDPNSTESTSHGTTHQPTLFD